MDTDPRLNLVERFFSGTGSTYDRIVNLCTLGIDKRWKRRILDKLPLDPRKAMDLACGTGILTLAIARRFSRCRVLGVELREEYLQFAREKVRTAGLGNVDLLLGRAEDVVLDDAFDCITSSYLAKYADLKALIPNLARMLKEGGLLLFHDFTYPANPMLAAGWEFYFKILQRFGTPRYPEWKNVFYELPEIVRRTAWVGDLQAALRENGLKEIRVESLTLQGSAIVTAKK